MLTLVLLTLWEMALYTLPDLHQLPDTATAGILTVLLWLLAFMGAADVKQGGFMGRLAFLFGIAWYISSIGRWAAPVDAVYSEAGDGIGLVLSVAFLVLTPTGMLLTAFIGPAAHAANKFRFRNKE